MRYEAIISELVNRVGAIKYQYGLSVIYAALYGSQNYGLDDTDSDIDCIMVVRPTLGQLIDNPEINFELDFHNKGKAKIMDVMSFAKQLSKGSFNCFEALYSDYAVHEQDFKNEFVSQRDTIYHKYRWKLQKAVYGGISNALKEADRCTDSTDPEKYAKKIYEAYRLMDLYGKVNSDYLPDPYISGLETRILFGRIKYGQIDSVEEQRVALDDIVEPNLKEEDMPQDNFSVIDAGKTYLMKHIENDLPVEDTGAEEN